MECSLEWTAENYSYCPYILDSPAFRTHELEETSWCLRLCSDRLDEKGFGIWLFLQRSTDAGPYKFSAKYEMSLFATDDSVVFTEEGEHTFGKGDSLRFRARVTPDLFRLKDAELLRLRCRLWRGEGSVGKVSRFLARTRPQNETVSFVHRVKHFSALKPGVESTLQIPSSSNEGCEFTSKVWIQKWYSGEESIREEITPSDSNYSLRRKKISLLDVSGKMRVCGEVDYRFIGSKEAEVKMHRSLAKQVILKKRDKLLPNDELTLLCNYTFWTVAMRVIEETLHGIPMVTYKEEYHKEIDKNLGEGSENLSDLPSLLNDLILLYNEQILSDVELKTPTKTFPAHKNVLSARSAVFRAMFATEMREKITDCIRVDDLQDETVDQLLLFFYSDRLENLRWESAVQLYFAADKYDVQKLKKLCSDFLVENISTANVSELLLLADTHSDAKLKKFAEQFIFEHEEEVFSSDEWENLRKTHSDLVLDTMLLKYKREGGKKIKN